MTGTCYCKKMLQLIFKEKEVFHEEEVFDEIFEKFFKEEVFFHVTEGVFFLINGVFP